MKKTEKATVIADLAEKLSKSSSSIFVDFTKMNVPIAEALKADLKKSNARMLVAKNTLIRIAATQANLPKEASQDSILSGQTAVIYTNDDSVAPIQALGNFLKKSEIPQPKAGVIDGVFYDKAQLIAISKLPGKKDLYAQAIGSMLSPVYGLVGTLNGNLQKLVMILQAKAAQG